jgi:hypothetical protein
MPSKLRRLHFSLFLAAFAAVSLFSASSTSASVTFTLVNNSSASLRGDWFSDDWYNPPKRETPPPCSGGAWVDGYTPAWGYTMDPGMSAWITLSDSPWSDCDGWSQIPTDGIAGWFPPDGPDAPSWMFKPDDPPSPWAASLTCSQWIGEPPVQFSVDGLTCTVSNPPSTPSANFVSSTAALRHGYALIPVQLFAKPGVAGLRGRFEIVLRDRKGHVEGRGGETLSVGFPRAVLVPVDRAARKRVAKHKHATVRATLSRIDGNPGTGDRAKLILQRRRVTPGL